MSEAVEQIEVVYPSDLDDSPIQDLTNADEVIDHCNPPGMTMLQLHYS